MTTELINSVSKGLGAVVWWDLGETAITPIDLRAIVAGEGASITVPDIDQSSAVKRAAREWTQGRGLADRFRAEVVAEDTSTVTVGILRRERVASDEVRWTQVDAAIFTLATGTWTTGSSPEAIEYTAEADKLRTHLDHAWIRPELIMAELHAMHSCTLRRQGGIYYVPSQYAEELGRLQRIVAKIGSSALHVASLTADDSTRSAVGSSARAHLLDGLAAAKEKLVAWKDSARKANGPAVDRCIADLVDLAATADLYRDALAIEVEDIGAALDAARAEAMALMGMEKPGAPRGEADSDVAAKRRADRARLASRIWPDFNALVVAARAQYGDTLTSEQIVAAGFKPRFSKESGPWWWKRTTLASIGIHANVRPDTTGGRMVTFSDITPNTTPPQGDEPEPTDEQGEAPEAQAPVVEQAPAATVEIKPGHKVTPMSDEEAASTEPSIDAEDERAALREKLITNNTVPSLRKTLTSLGVEFNAKDSKPKLVELLIDAAR